MEFNTNLFQRPIQLVHSSVNLHKHCICIHMCISIKFKVEGFFEIHSTKFRTLLYVKQNEIVTKFCRNMLRDTCRGIVTRFNVKNLCTSGHENGMPQ